MTNPDFAAAVRALPKRIDRVMRGRNPDVGLDCSGLVIAVYRLAGLPIDDVDVTDYGDEDHKQKRHMLRLMCAQLSLAFDDVSHELTTGGKSRDGDVLMLWSMDVGWHLSIIVGQMAYHMGDKLYEQRAGPLLTRARKCWRHKALNATSFSGVNSQLLPHD